MKVEKLKVVVMGGVPIGKSADTNFFKIHTIASKEGVTNNG
jgi:hypothetical protein